MQSVAGFVACETMTVTYTILRYAGRPEKTVTVTGDMAKLVMSYADNQEEIGIKIVDVKP